MNIIEQYCTAGEAWLLRAGRLRTSRADAVPWEPRLFHSSCNPMVILPQKCFGKSSSSFGSVPDIGQLFHHQILFLYTDIKVIYMPNHRRFITSTTIETPPCKRQIMPLVRHAILALFLATEKSTFLLLRPIIFRILVLLLKFAFATSFVAIGSIRSDEPAASRVHAQGSQSSRRRHWWRCVIRICAVVIPWTLPRR